MNNIIRSGLSGVMFWSTIFQLNATEVTESCNQNENITFITNDIFNLEDPDTIALHRWANFFI